jgi:phenylacetate-CoA ligase
MLNLTGRTHELLSRHLLLPLSHLKAQARPDNRRMMQAYYDGLAFRAQTADWSAERRREWTLAQLRRVVRRAYLETAYYQEQFDRIGFDPVTDFSFADYACLPTLNRAEVQCANCKLVSTAIPPEWLRRDSTGGSTGAPTEIRLGPEERGWRESSGEFFRRRLGVPTGVRTALFWGHHLDPVVRDGWRDRYYAFSTHTRWFDCFRLSPERLEYCHREFEQWRPDCIIAYASALGHLAEHLIERGRRPNYPGICFITGAEKLMPHHRALIERVFGRPVHERYGSRDAGYLAFQMRPTETLDFETDWPSVMIEPESDETESEILVTKLRADGMPMLRYRLGDLGRFPRGSEPGHPVFILHEITGRSTDRIFLPDRRWISGLQLPHLLKDFPVYEFMLIQREDYSVELMIVPRQDFRAADHQRILLTLRENLPGLPVNSLLVNEIPRTRANKWRPVTSEVKTTAGQAV